MKKIVWMAALNLTALVGYGQTNYVATNPSSTTPGSDNTLVGVGAGNLNMSGAGNIFIGKGSGMQNMGGTQNAFVGALSGSSNTGGYGNAFLGYASGYSNSTGTNNTFLGAGAGYKNVDGYNNVFSGYNAGYSNGKGSYNAFFGSGAGFANTQGNENTFLGADAGGSNLTGSGNTYVGSMAGVGNATSTSNVPSLNTFLGASTGKSNEGSANTFIGYQAGQNNKSGGYNVFVGYLAGANNTTGLGNLFLGQQAGLNNSEGNYNLFMGNGAGRGTTTGAGNTSIGDGAFLSNTTGAGNTAIGRYAGINITTGSNNTFIGLAATAPSGSGTISNATAIGYNAQVTASNSMVLGSGVNVGIGTSAPNNKLEVVSSASNTSGLRLTNLKSSSPVTVATAKYLTVDANGDVVLGSASGSGRVASEDANWTIDGEHLKNTNAGGIIIGPGVNTTPAGYRLYVADGVLTEKLKVAVKSTNDWSDRVFEGSYRLRSLKEVEQFIDRNKHLPGVPSAEEVVVQGVDVGQMQAKLLEKVEELTLYVIDLKKENETLKKKVSKIESGRRARVKGKL